jgi:hypothetical protein
MVRILTSRVETTAAATFLPLAFFGSPRLTAQEQSLEDPRCYVVGCEANMCVDGDYAP